MCLRPIGTSCMFSTFGICTGNRRNQFAQLRSHVNTPAVILMGLHVCLHASFSESFYLRCVKLCERYHRSCEIRVLHVPWHLRQLRTFKRLARRQRLLSQQDLDVCLPTFSLVQPDVVAARCKPYVALTWNMASRPNRACPFDN